MNNENSNLFVYTGALPGTPAEKASLRIGDKLLSLNGITLLNFEDLSKGIQANPLRRVFEVLRGTEVILIEIDMSSQQVCNTNQELN